MKIFTAKGFATCIRAGDSRRFNINLVDNRNTILSSAAQDAYTGKIQFSPHYISRIKRRSCISIKDYKATLVLRAVAKYLRRKLALKMPSRESIVAGVINALSDSTPLFVIRRDLKSFYETIPIEAVRDELIYDTAIPKRTRNYIRHYFETFSPQGIGLPRGLALSAVMAELAMREFDRKIRGIDGVSRYFRYSDDILIIAFKNIDEIESALASELPTGMSFSADKNEKIAAAQRDTSKATTVRFEYLGYQFEMPDHASNKFQRTVRVSIGPNKIARTKTRVILSLKHYIKNRDFILLRDRLKFLSANYRVYRTGIAERRSSRYIKSGIYYSYRLCGEYRGELKLPHTCNELKALDAFYFSLLKGSSSQFMRELSARLTQQQFNELCRLSFYKGHEKRIMVRFNPMRVRDIKAAWVNA